MRHNNIVDSRTGQKEAPESDYNKKGELKMMKDVDSFNSAKMNGCASDRLINRQPQKHLLRLGSVIPLAVLYME